nr:uncharacterized protein LOC110357193 isoform X1 [Columba livia]XP_021140105.1 uncharacterized protein LOC110357193 isoform X1 [Columba livia]
MYTSTDKNYIIPYASSWIRSSWSHHNIIARQHQKGVPIKGFLDFQLQYKCLTSVLSWKRFSPLLFQDRSNCQPPFCLQTERFAIQSNVKHRIPQKEEKHLIERNLLNVLGAAVALEEDYPYEHKMYPLSNRFQPQDTWTLTAGFFCNCLQLPLLKVYSFLLLATEKPQDISARNQRSVLSTTGAMGHSVEATSALTEICRLAGGRDRETLHTRYHGKGRANSCPIKPEAHTKQAEERGRWRTEHLEAKDLKTWWL